MRNNVKLAMIIVILLIGVEMMALTGEVNSTHESVWSMDASFAGGTGTVSNPYQITNVSDLQDIEKNLSAHYVLTGDINASETSDWNSGQGFTPIGSSSIPFTGTLDGDGYTISGIYINRNINYVGLIGCTGSSVRISNLSIEGATVTGKGEVGILIGSGYGTLFNCHSEGSVTGSLSWVGGLSGYQYGVVENCTSEVTVRGSGGIGGLMGGTQSCYVVNCTSVSNVGNGNTLGGITGRARSGSVYLNCTSYSNVSGADYVGGFIGRNGGSVMDCRSMGNTANGDEYVGGFIGSNDISVLNCSSTTTVTGRYMVGGFAGENSRIAGSISKSRCYSTVIGSSGRIGGLVGVNFGKVSESFFIGSVRGGGAVGGIAGWSNYNAIKNCYAKGNVRGTKGVGGLVGNLENSVQHSYFIGNVTGANVWMSNVGGIAGELDSRASVQNCTSSGKLVGGSCMGGIAGTSNGDVSESFAQVIVKGASLVGGVVGYNRRYARITECVAYGNVSGTSGVGGIAGTLDNGRITDCYSRCNLSGSSNIHGLVPGTRSVTRVVNSFYDINSTTINGKRSIDLFGVFKEQFDDWLNNDFKIMINDHLDRNDADGSYNLTTPEDVRAILPFAYYKNHVYSLQNDIDMSNDKGVFIPYIGAGIIEGNGHVISNLSVSLPGRTEIGFIGKAEEDTSFRNLSLIDVDIKGKDEVGGLVGRELGEIMNCTVSGSISGSISVGGLVGEGNGRISNSTVSVSVSGKDEVGGLIGNNQGQVETSLVMGNITGTQDYVGGLVGFNAGDLSHSRTDVNVIGRNYVGGLIGISSPTITATISYSIASGTISGNNQIGGLIGSNFPLSDLKECSTTGNISGNRMIGGVIGANSGKITNSISDVNTSGAEEVGGFCGKNEGQIELSNSFGSVIGSLYSGGFVGLNGNEIDLCISKADVHGGIDSSNLGGFAGVNDDDGSISRSFSTGNVSADDSIGGFVGKNIGNIEDCFTTANITGNSEVGGFVGMSEGGLINRSYCSGKVIGTVNVGGFSGLDTSPSNGSFWDNQTTGLSKSGSGTGLNTTEMRNKTHYEEAGWDLFSTWIVGNGTSYPFLRQFYYPVRMFGDHVIVCTEDQPYSVQYSAVACSVPGMVSNYSFSLDTSAEWMSITPDGLLSGIPLNEDVGSVVVRVIATDAAQTIDDSVFTLTVINTNDPPEISTLDIDTVLEGEEYLVEYDAIDIDPTNDKLTWTITTNASWLEVIGTTVWGEPGNDDVGTFWVNVTVSDGKDGFDGRNFTIRVENVNDPPVLLNSTMSNCLEDTPYAFRFHAEDIDATNDILEWEIVTDASFLTLDRSMGEVSGIPGNDDVGKYIIEVIVTDGQGGRCSKNYTFFVIGVNDPPECTISSLDLEGDEDGEILTDLSTYFTDIDSDLTFEIGEGINITCFLFNAEVEITPNLDWSGVEVVIFSASDGEFVVNLTARVIIYPVNDAPFNLILNYDQTYPHNGTQMVSATASDKDLPYGDTLTFLWSSNVTGEIGSGNEIDLQLPEGNHTITVVVSDQEGISIQESFFVKIIGPEKIPDDGGDDKPDNGDEIPDNGDEKPENKTEPDSEGGSSGGLVWILVVVAVSFLVVIGCIVFIFLRKEKEDLSTEEGEAEGESPSTEQETTPSVLSPQMPLEIKQSQMQMMLAQKQNIPAAQAPTPQTPQPSVVQAKVGQSATQTGNSVNKAGP